MSYVRWGTRVRDGCAECGGTSLVPNEPTGTICDVLRERPCRVCTSCWYVYWSIAGCIQVHHACDAGDDVELPFEEAESWRPPESCPMGDVALTAVANAVADWKARKEPSR